MLRRQATRCLFTMRMLNNQKFHTRCIKYEKSENAVPFTAPKFASLQYESEKHQRFNSTRLVQVTKRYYNTSNTEENKAPENPRKNKSNTQGLRGRLERTKDKLETRIEKKKDQKEQRKQKVKEAKQSDWWLYLEQIVYDIVHDITLGVLKAAMRLVHWLIELLP